MLERVLTPPEPFHPRLTLGLLVRGRRDPTARWASPTELWRATRSPDGPASLSLRFDAGTVEARVWGPGAAWVLEHLPDLLGCHDDPRAFGAHHPVLRKLHRRFAGMRIGRTGVVMESLVPAILEQKVTGAEAHRSWVRLVTTYGEPAPGPLGLTLAPDPAVIAALPYWRLHPLGVERKRAETLLRACASARRLSDAAAMPISDAYRRLQAIRGIGAWTAAEVATVALGDPDAVSVGDFHLKHVVAWVLAGEPRATDERMLELLAPYAGQRARAVRYIELSGLTPPKFGPRLKRRSIARI